MVINPRTFRKMFDRCARFNTPQSESPILTTWGIFETHSLGQLGPHCHCHGGVVRVGHGVPLTEVLRERVTPPDHIEPGEDIVRTGFLSEPDQVLHVERTKFVIVITEKNPLRGDPVQSTLPRRCCPLAPMIRSDAHLVHGVGLRAYAPQSAIQQLGTGWYRGDSHAYGRTAHARTPIIAWNLCGRMTPPWKFTPPSHSSWA